MNIANEIAVTRYSYAVENWDDQKIQLVLDQLSKARTVRAKAYREILREEMAGRLAYRLQPH